MQFLHALVPWSKFVVAEKAIVFLRTALPARETGAANVYARISQVRRMKPHSGDCAGHRQCCVTQRDAIELRDGNNPEDTQLRGIKRRLPVRK